MLTREQFGRNLPLDFGVQDAAWNRDRRSFDMSGFRQPITQEQAELMKELTGYNLALNPNTARLLQMGRTEVGLAQQCLSKKAARLLRQ